MTLVELVVLLPPSAVFVVRGGSVLAGGTFSVDLVAVATAVAKLSEVC